MIDILTEYFEHIRLSPPDWPIHVSAAMAGPATFERWPEYPIAATAARGRIGNGRGTNAEECRRRALGEIVETTSCCAWGDEAVSVAPYSEVAERALSPELLNGFAEWQCGNRADWNDRLTGLDWIPPDFRPETPIGWMTAKRLDSDAEILVPADCILIGRREQGDPDACAVADTNGCAAGATAEAALLAALYELIERDASARWWYGQGLGHRIDPSRVKGGEAVVRNLSGRGRGLWLLDITSDIPVPTVAAIATNHARKQVGIGFATRAKLSQAAETALAELMQIELKIAAAIERPDLMPDIVQWFREADLGAKAPFGAIDASGNGALTMDIATGLAACRAILDRSGCRVAVIEMTRPEFGIPVFRAISPDLCHWKPRFGRHRLAGRDGADLEHGFSAGATRTPPLLRI